MDLRRKNALNPPENGAASASPSPAPNENNDNDDGDGDKNDNGSKNTDSKNQREKALLKMDCPMERDLWIKQKFQRGVIIK